MNDTGRHLTRLGAVAAIGGSVIALVATALHPMGADPNDSAAAFAEYAADSRWVGTSGAFTIAQSSRRRSPGSRPWR